MVIVNLNKYQILLKTVELGSITRAAEALGYTQSAVSRVIADLEREWDMELLTRSRTGVVLSSSGAALLPYVQAVCNAGRELEEQVAELHGLTRGTLRVATFASVSIHWLPAIMKEFLGRYPGIQFDLVSNWEFAEVEDLLRQGQADCGFLGLPAGPGLETYPLFRDELMAQVRGDVHGRRQQDHGPGHGAVPGGSLYQHTGGAGFGDRPHFPGGGIPAQSPLHRQ